MSGEAAHWDEVYRATPSDSLSWYEPRPVTSLRLLALASPARGPVVDVGAGTSFLADRLVEDGWADVTVLDLSPQALDVVRARLRTRSVTYVAADVLAWEPEPRYAAWHDRAVFHFLTADEDKARYVATAASAVVPGGAAVLAVFAPDGPRQCSGLPTARYDAQALADVFAPAFSLEHAEREEHVTPASVVQPFTWVVLRRT